jgi:hypothetical protein
MGQFRRTFLLKQFVPRRCVAAAIGDEGELGAGNSRDPSVFREGNEVKDDYFSTNQT